jgi:hypothetical protein
MVLEAMFLRYRAEKGDTAVGDERSMTHDVRLERVPEVVAWEAEADGMMVREL